MLKWYYIYPLDSKIFKCFRSELGLWFDRRLIGLLVELDGQGLQDFSAVLVIIQQRFGKMRQLKR
jgi:hypothetical protein